MSPVQTFKIVVLVAALGAGLIVGRMILPAQANVPEPVEELGSAHAEPTPRPAANALFPVIVNLPEGPPRTATDEFDLLGRPITVSCASCHANLVPNVSRRSAEVPPMTFHKGLTFAHGDLSCLSCHNAQDYNTLRLADSSSVAYPDLMDMCAQCHAPQARDWANGAHGGMTGYWDRARGPRFRKNCIDCHDPHAPAFPKMTPTFKPRDRFLEPRRGASGGGHE